MSPDEVLLSVHIPFTQQLEFTREFKQSPRRDDDIAIVNAGVILGCILSVLDRFPTFLVCL